MSDAGAAGSAAAAGAPAGETGGGDAAAPTDVHVSTTDSAAAAKVARPSSGVDADDGGDAAERLRALTVSLGIANARVSRPSAGGRGSLSHEEDDTADRLAALLAKHSGRGDGTGSGDPAADDGGGGAAATEAELHERLTALAAKLGVPVSEGESTDEVQARLMSLMRSLESGRDNTGPHRDSTGRHVPHPDAAERSKGRAGIAAMEIDFSGAADADGAEAAGTGKRKHKRRSGARSGSRGHRGKPPKEEQAGSCCCAVM